MTSDQQQHHTPPFTAALLQDLATAPDHGRTLQGIVDLAQRTVPHSDSAGVTVRRGKNLTTPAWTDEVVVRVDQAQYDAGEGPCLDAVWVDDTYVVDDLTRDPRWPRWAPEAVRLGIVSMLSVRLATPQDVVGGLNLYANRAHAFDEDDVQIAHSFAEHAAPALALSQELTGLRSALQTRHRIGAAQGILRARYGLDLEQAFTVLVRLSRDNNVRLRDVAELVIEDSGLPARFGGGTAL